MQIKGLGHASVKIINLNNSIIYVDPYDLDRCSNDASYIFITHDHYDHYSIKDIKKVINKNSIIIAPKRVVDQLDQDLQENNIEFRNILEVEPNNFYQIDDQKEQINFKTVEAYNIDKDFHKKEYNYVGYILDIDNCKIYIAGDTDDYGQDKILGQIDYAIVPIGGTYTMNAKQAANLVNKIAPKYAIAYHYGKIVGGIEDREEFKFNLDPNIAYIEINEN